MIFENVEPKKSVQDKDAMFVLDFEMKNFQVHRDAKSTCARQVSHVLRFFWVGGISRRLSPGDKKSVASLMFRCLLLLRLILILFINGLFLFSLVTGFRQASNYIDCVSEGSSNWNGFIF